MKTDFIKIGLTGGIATGKSTLCDFAPKMGIAVIDADSVARSLMKKEGEIYKEVVQFFGEKILSINGDIDRGLLASIVFNNPSELKKLNAIIHPKVSKEILKKCKDFAEKGSDIILCESAILIEAGYKDFFDFIIVVTCDEKKQIERLTKKANLTKKEAIVRIRAQMPLKEKEKYGDYVIENNGTIEELKHKFEDVIEKIKRLKCQELHS